MPQGKLVPWEAAFGCGEGERHRTWLLSAVMLLGESNVCDAAATAVTRVGRIINAISSSVQRLRAKDATATVTGRDGVEARQESSQSGGRVAEDRMRTAANLAISAQDHVRIRISIIHP